MKLFSASALWCYCEFENCNGKVGPYEFRTEYTRRGDYDYYFPSLGVRVRRYPGDTKWIPRRPSDDTLMLLRLAATPVNTTVG